MSLNLSLLEKVREAGNGFVQARCPACAEVGQDRKGEHLRIYPDGRFGCCIHPKDGAHRKRIFALAGDRTPRVFTVKLAKVARASEPLHSVKKMLLGFSGTAGTAKTESNLQEIGLIEPLGTHGTYSLNPRAYAKEIETDISHILETHKEFETAVPSVPQQTTPYLLSDGTLVIPFASEERFHWWRSGQSIAETHKELLKGGDDANAF